MKSYCFIAQPGGDRLQNTRGYKTTKHLKNLKLFSDGRREREGEEGGGREEEGVGENSRVSTLAS